MGGRSETQKNQGQDQSQSQSQATAYHKSILRALAERRAATEAAQTEALAAAAPQAADPAPTAPVAMTDLEAATSILFRVEAGDPADYIRLEDVGPYAPSDDGTAMIRAPVDALLLPHQSDNEAPSRVSEQVIASFASIGPGAKVVLDLAREQPGKVVIGGGSVAAAVWNPSNPGSRCDDIDVFVCGTQEDHEAFVNELHRRLENVARGVKNPFGEAAKIQRLVGERTVTFVGVFESHLCCSSDPFLPIKPVQVIMRTYERPMDVAFSFDLGSAALAIHNEQVWVTPAGKFALERGLNIVHLSRRRPGYETRVAKYARRGFGILFPDGDLAAFEAKRGEVEMPYLMLDAFGVSARVDGHIVSEYQEGGVSYWPGNVVARNVKALLTGRTSALVGMSLTGDHVPLREVVPFMCAKSLARWITVNTDGNCQSLRRLAATIGEPLATTVAEIYTGLAICGKQISPCQYLGVADIAVDAAPQLRPIFGFLNKGEGLEGRRSMLSAEPVTAEEWYGDMLRKDPAEQ